MYFKRPIESVADMKGIRFRSYSDATVRLAALTGMPAVRVEAAAIREALAEGRAEALISSGAIGHDRRLWDYLSHFCGVFVPGYRATTCSRT